MVFGFYSSPVGRLTLAAEEDSLTGLWLEGQRHYGATLPPNAVEDGCDPFLGCAFRWLDRYFAGSRPDPAELAPKPAGTAFQQRVWRLLLDIPYGELTTYGALARLLGETSPRAVGGAVGRNPISIVIPCHRVVGAGGALTGYAGGLETKRRLLELEGATTRERL